MTPGGVKFVRWMARVAGDLNARPTKEETGQLVALLTQTEGQARYWHHLAHAHLTDNPACSKLHTFGEFEDSVKKEWGI